MLEEKQSLAAAAVSMIRPGHSMFVSGGSTMEIVSQELARLSTLCVITNNIHAAFHLYSNSEIELLMPCGRVRHHNGGIIGPAAINFIDNFQTDFLLMGIGAISPDGLLLDYHYEEALLMSRMIKNAQEVLLVTDSSKFQKKTMAQVGHLRDVTYLVTECEPPDRIKKIMEEHHVSLVIPD